MTVGLGMLIIFLFVCFLFSLVGHVGSGVKDFDDCA